ncbi:MAG: nickel insertion protein, partial [Acidobacteriota bacterium]
LAAPEAREELVALIFRETTTLDVRFYTAERRVQPREFIEVTTRFGPVRIKAGSDGFAPEFEDARRVATASGVALKQVLAEAAYEYLKKR